MRKKIIIIILTAIIIICLLYLLFFILNKTDPNGSLININNGTVQVKNINSISLEKTVGKDTIIAENDNYIIDYYNDSQAFSIIILNRDFFKGRKIAEKDILKILNINKKEACQLNITIGTIYSYNPDYAGYTYPLSYCEKK